jgi:hypothetical protein
MIDKSRMFSVSLFNIELGLMREQIGRGLMDRLGVMRERVSKR